MSDMKPELGHANDTFEAAPDVALDPIEREHHGMYFDNPPREQLAGEGSAVVEGEVVDADETDSADDAEPAPAAAQPRDDEPRGDGSDDDEPDADESDDDEGGSRPSKRRESLESEGEIAADYLEELLDIADLDGDIDTFVEAGRARVAIITDEEKLVGRDGEVLEALQELARLAVMTETGKRSRLMLDVGGHRDKRRKELEALAQDAVLDVKESGEPVRLAPMNPFERKIVHDAVAAAGLASESEGVEPQRRVIVLPS